MNPTPKRRRITRCGMNECGARRRLYIGRTGLRNQAGQQTGQHIAHASRGHAGIAPVDQHRDAARSPDQTAATLEDHGAAILAAELGQRGKPVGLHSGAAAAKQAPGFTHCAVLLKYVR